LSVIRQVPGVFDLLTQLLDPTRFLNVHTVVYWKAHTPRRNSSYV